MVRSGRVRVKDAANVTLGLESRFDLAYDAAHSLSLAALRWHGYRSENRYLVFQTLTHTLGLDSTQWRVERMPVGNASRQEGHFYITSTARFRGNVIMLKKEVKKEPDTVFVIQQGRKKVEHNSYSSYYRRNIIGSMYEIHHCH